MAYYNETTAPAGVSPSRSAAFFDRIVFRMRQRRASRDTFKSLVSLTDRELADIGLNRGDLHRIAREAGESVS